MEQFQAVFSSFDYFMIFNMVQRSDSKLASYNKNELELYKNMECSVRVGWQIIAF